jgi:threonyl-tRNA synthetase
MWLSPVQARVITVSEKAEAYGREVAGVLAAADLRVDSDLSADKLNAKIRRAQLEKIPYMLVVGERDMAARVVSPRTRDGKQLPAQSLDEIVKILAAEAAVPSLPVPQQSPA